MDFRAILEEIIRDSSLHARWLNTLSYMENCGAKLIAACEHPTMVPKEVLKHAAEEFRHAYYMKGQIEKISSESLPTYQLHEMLGGYSARHYLYRLNARIARFLKLEKGLSGSDLKQYAYWLVTYAIEKRAEEIYPLYQELLIKHAMPISIAGIIREEEHHLQEITEEMEGTKAEVWGVEVCVLEHLIFNHWVTRLGSRLT